MREIKFRAWYPSSGEMIANEHLCVIASEPAFIMEPSHAPFTDSTLILMQFTGLQDSEGVDIYEGDIVRVDEFWPRDDGKFDDVLFFCGWLQDSCCFWFQGIAPFPDMGLTVEAEHEALIIGNIHENPEIIK